MLIWVFCFFQLDFLVDVLCHHSICVFLDNRQSECKPLSVSNSPIMSLIIDDAIINSGLTQ